MIRKLKILIACKERELRSCSPKSRDRVRNRLAALRVALLMARNGSISHRSNLKQGCDHRSSGAAA